jgi:hypothetical protein
VSPVKYELGFYIAEDDILHSHRLENFKSYMSSSCSTDCDRSSSCSHQLASSPYHETLPNSVDLVRKRNIPIERTALVAEF